MKAEEMVKGEEMLNEIENLLADLHINVSLLQEELLKKYDNDVPEEQYLNDIGCIKFWNKTIREFLCIKD